MGSMSASDAAPLPRLGEVFFDVRGNSRSMRLSWYADTGVAVFSIWQGGTCTGTFRLPMDDLQRMIEALRRGPQGSARTAREAVPPGRDAVAGGGSPDPGQATASMRRPEGEGGAGAAGYGSGPARTYRRDSAGYPDPLSPDYPAEQLDDYRTGAGTGDFRAATDAGYPDVPVTGDYRRTGPEPAYPDEADSGAYRRGGRSGGYPAAPGYPADPGYPAGADYPPEGYRGETSGNHRRDSGGYPAAPPDYRGGSSGGHRRDSSGYPEDQAYPGDPGFHGYSRQHDIADYPGAPASGGSGAYPAGPDYGQHDAGWGEDTADQSLGSYADEPPAESFPYGRRGGNRESRERGRYPGRH
jgi:hypothetical protein